VRGRLSGRLSVPERRSFERRRFSGRQRSISDLSSFFSWFAKPPDVHFIGSDPFGIWDRGTFAFNFNFHCRIGGFGFGLRCAAMELFRCAVEVDLVGFQIKIYSFRHSLRNQLTHKH
jgi:hypothetical protein